MLKSEKLITLLSWFILDVSIDRKFPKVLFWVSKQSYFQSIKKIVIGYLFKSSMRFSYNDNIESSPTEQRNGRARFITKRVILGSWKVSFEVIGQ